MGLFGKLKHFAGGHGVTVSITEIERQVPEGASFSLRKEVLQGRIQVQGEKEVGILKHVFQFWAVYEDEDDEDESGEFLLGESEHEGEVVGAAYAWPYTLKPGQPVEDSFSIGPFDIGECMEEWDLSFEDAASDPHVRFELRIVADVKGSPMDATTEQQVAIVAGDTGANLDDARAAQEEDEEGEALVEIPVRCQSLPLDPDPFFFRFEEMVAELENHPLIEVTEVSVNVPASTSEIDAIAAEFPVPAAVRAFYEKCNGLTLRWEIPGTDQVEDQWGGINILPIAKVYGSWKDVVWFDEDWDDGSNKALHPIEFIDGDTFCGFLFDGTENPKIFFKGDEKQSLEVDFAGYLELLLKSRGYGYWPKAIVADLTGKEYTIEPGDFRRNMPKLFPDFDPSFFLRRDYAAKDAAMLKVREDQTGELRVALDAQGAEYAVEAGYSGAIRVKLVDSADNFSKVAKGLISLGLDTDFDGSWGSKIVGNYHFERG